MLVSAFDKDLNYDWSIDGDYREFAKVKTEYFIELNENNYKYL